MSGKSLCSLSPLDHLSPHHVGFVVASIQECGQTFALAPVAAWAGNILFDPIQKPGYPLFRDEAQPIP